MGHEHDRFVAVAVLGRDGDDSRSVSLALLAIDVPFRPAMLLLLSVSAFAGAGLALLRARHGRTGLIGRATQVATVGFTAAVVLRAALGCWWLFTPDEVPGTFYWLNLALYTPLCAVLAWFGLQLIGPLDPTRRHTNVRRLMSGRVVALVLPSALVAVLVVAAYAYSPPTQSH